MKIILGSSSPFRRDILARLNLPFECISPNIDESSLEGEAHAELVERLAIAKAQAISEKCEAKALIIGSDQVAIVDNAVLGKPGNYENAKQQLLQSSGKKVTFLTGLALVNSENREIQADVIPFHVTFRKLSESMIESYLNKEKPYNCAGSFKSEGLGIALFEKMEGEDPSALIGLPLIRLIKMLENEGVRVI